MTSGGPSPLIPIGYVARAHGVRGELRVVTHDPASTTLQVATAIHLADIEYQVESARRTEGGWLLAVHGVRDREAATALRGSVVSVPREIIPVDEHEVLLADLIGCRVELPDGSAWGEVVAFEAGPQDRLVIHDGELERLLPVVDELIVDIDVQAGLVIVDPPADWPSSPRRK